MSKNKYWIIFIFGLTWSRITREMFDISIFSPSWWAVTMVLGLVVLFTAETIWWGQYD